MLIFLGFISGTIASATDPKPRQWHQQWSMPFHEEIVITGVPAPIVNEGKWYYDFPNKRSRFDHLQGQQNNFCGCANNNTKSDCHLLFAADETLYVHFPTLNGGKGECCSICGGASGCTTLKPDWMSNGNYTYDGSWVYTNNTKCYRWQEPGAVATDIWSSTLDAVDTPCQYKETFGPTITHTLDFYLDQFKIGPSAFDPSVFDVPEICHKKCERQFPADCG